MLTTPIVDADSHITEPADLWTARVLAKHADVVPRVALHPKTNHHHWIIGDRWIWPVGFFSQAGWNEYPPLTPWEFDEVDPGTFDAAIRLKRMDEYGIRVQILYPNLIGFQAPLFIDLGPELALLCTRVYNDFMLEWAAADPQRLIPIAMLPFWDVDAAVKEMERTVALGYKGVLFANKFERLSLPGFCDPYWDPVYAAAQVLDVSINYHVGFSSFDMSEFLREEAISGRREAGAASRPGKALSVTSVFMSQTDLLGTILTSGLCDRFPRLKLVSVESGFGQVPFYLDSLDWHWRAYGNVSELLPSEYFMRQCYGTFWFERMTLPLLERFPDNFMFSTDYPHGTSLTPGPASPAEIPSVHIEHAFAGIDPEVTAKAICGNAAAVYKLDVPPTAS